jgi:hypothetical protein
MNDKGNFPDNPKKGDWCSNMKGTWEYDGTEWVKIKIAYKEIVCVERAE